MKKITNKIIALLLVVTLCGELCSSLCGLGNKGVQASEESANVFSQGDFEGSDLRNWSWATLKNNKVVEGGDLATTLNGAGDNYMIHLRSEEAARNGSYGFYVDGDVIYSGANGGYKEAPRGTVKDLVSGATYQLSFWVKALSDSANVRLHCYQWTTDWGTDVSSTYDQGITNVSSNDGWKKIQIEFTMKAGRTALQFDTVCQGGQQIYVDDYAIEMIEDAPEAGLVVADGETYATKENLASVPHTWETWLEWKGSEAVIVEDSASEYSVEVSGNGHPVLKWKGTELTFDDVTLTANTKQHLAIVKGDSAVICYLDGKAVQTLEANSTEEPTVGTANIGSSAVKLYSLAVYSEARNAEKVGLDKERVEYTEEAVLLLACDFHDVGNDRLEDHSTYNNHLSFNDGTNTDVFDETGLALDVNDQYLTTDEFTTIPLTYEAEICLPKELADEDSKYEYGGVILGNVGDSASTNSSVLSFEVHVDGHPGIYFTSGAGGKERIKFNEVEVRTGEWLHLTVTLDETAKEAKCYVNGELKQTVKYTMTLPSPIKANNTNWRDLVVGGDYRYANEKYFRGKIKSVATYSDVRTSDEVLADMTNTIVKGTDDCTLAYQMTHEDFGGLTYNQLWKRNIATPAASSYAYSMAVVGDTQTVNWYGTEAEFDAIYDYIVEQDSYFCIGLGDITEMGTQEREYELAKKNHDKLTNAGIPYAIVRGNHDDAGRMDAYFPYQNYKAQLGGSYNGSMTNTWQVFELGGVNYMILCLDYFPSQSVLDWAKTVVDEHPNHNVILVTHSFLHVDGTVVKSDSVDAFIKGTDSNYPDNGLWDLLVSKCDNIKMVLSGHLSTASIVHSTLEREGMSSVEAMLIDPQGMDAKLGSTGMVAMLYFDEPSNGQAEIGVQYYSTVRKEYYSATASQFTTSINLENSVNAESIGTVSSLTRTGGSSTNGYSEITMSCTGVTVEKSVKFAGQVIDTSDESRVNVEMILNTNNTMTIRVPNSVLPDEFIIPAETFVSYDLTKSFTVAEATTITLLVRLDFTCETDKVAVNYNSTNNRTYLEVITDKTLPFSDWSLYTGSVAVDIDGESTKVQGTQALGTNKKFQFYFKDGSGDVRKTAKKIVIPEGTEIIGNGVTVRFVNDFALINDNGTWKKNVGSLTYENISEDAENESIFANGTFDTQSSEMTGWASTETLGASELKVVTEDTVSTVMDSYIKFENKTVDKTPSGWTSDSTTTTVVKELDGNKVLETVIGPGKYFRCYGDVTKLDATKTYAMILRMKTTEGNSGKVKFLWRGTSKSMICDVTDEWAEYRLEINIPSEGTPNAIAWETGDQKEATYYIDDLQLVEVTQKTDTKYEDVVSLNFNNKSKNAWNMGGYDEYVNFDTGVTGESSDFALTLNKVDGSTPAISYYGMTITAGEKYRATFDAKATGSAKNLKCYFGGNGDISQTLFELTDEWNTYHTVTFTSLVSGTNSDNSKCFFQAYSSSEVGMVYIDNIKIERVTSEEPVYDYSDGYGTANGAEDSNVFMFKNLEKVWNTGTAVNLTAGMGYKLLFDIRTEDTQTSGETPFEVSVGIDNGDTNKTKVIDMEHNGGWQTIEYDFTAPAENVASTKIVFSRQGTGTVYLDNFRLYKNGDTVLPKDTLLENGATLHNWSGVTSIRCFNGVGAKGSVFTKTSTKVPDVTKSYVLKFRADVTNTSQLSIAFGDVTVLSNDLSGVTGWKDFTCVISPNHNNGEFVISSVDGKEISLDDVTIYEKYQTGDANGDGSVDVRDMVRYKKGFKDETLFATYVFSDITGTGDGFGYNRNGIVINLDDLKALREWLLN